VSRDEQIAARIEGLCAPPAAGLGLALVQVSYQRESSGWVLRVLVERPGGAVTVEDCSRLSRELSVVLDVEDALPQAYQLEVSSPGLDRPLITLQDFARFVGREITLRTHAPQAGRRNYRGRLVGVAGDELTLEVDGQRQIITHGSVSKANLVPELPDPKTPRRA